ncbi:serine/arginine repetitive matrix protein 1-like [Equus quagga]|uniref:serine/arginine repetitive matrix protein 1-like n=1 Tax=Equus quagga TaxID=89248 RepID=UPI001EE36194|nr:serine/arginine repetitive matrix protein 1-like [Equus quagga]
MGDGNHRRRRLPQRGLCTPARPRPPGSPVPRRPQRPAQPGPRRGAHRGADPETSRARGRWPEARRPPAGPHTCLTPQRDLRAPKPALGLARCPEASKAGTSEDPTRRVAPRTKVTGASHGSLLKNHTSQKSPRPRAFSAHREKNGPGSLGNHSAWGRRRRVAQAGHRCKVSRGQQSSLENSASQNQRQPSTGVVKTMTSEPQNYTSQKMMRPRKVFRVIRSLAQRFFCPRTGGPCCYRTGTGLYPGRVLSSETFSTLSSSRKTACGALDCLYEW